MNDVISKYVYRNPRTWDTFIPAMLMAYRTSVQDSMQFSPFYMLYGRDPVLPIDTLLQPKMRYMGDDYIPTLLHQLHQVHIDAKENLSEARERNKERINKKAILKQFAPGDAVYYYNTVVKPGESSKLAMKWHPFYRILRKISPVNYIIKHQYTGTTKTVHVKPS